jgi:transcriptional regulator with XRE-family HTH domain
MRNLHVYTFEISGKGGELMASRNTTVLYGLGGRIRETRERRGLSLTELSVAVGSDKSALSKIEKGERVPSLETIGRLADEMEMPMGAWFQELPSSNTETMKQFLDSQQSRLDKLSEDQLTNLQMLINQALNMAGA